MLVITGDGFEYSVACVLLCPVCWCVLGTTWVFYEDFDVCCVV